MGSREALAEYGADDLIWYPAEADISIRRRAFNSYGGWFYHENEMNKSANKLFRVYLNTAGRNASFLLNVPPTKDGVLDADTVKNLRSSATSWGLFIRIRFRSRRIREARKRHDRKCGGNCAFTDSPSNDFMLPSDEDIIDLKLENRRK